MLRGLSAVVSGVLIALVAAFAFAGRPTNARSEAEGSPDRVLSEARKISVRQYFSSLTSHVPVTPTLQSSQGNLLGQLECTPIWSNGEVDGISGLASQQTLAETADDLVLEDGGFYQIDQIELVMAVLPNGPVSAQLRIFDDCNGKPAAQLASYPATDVTSLGTNPNFPGLTFYRFVFGDLGIFEPGGKRLWISPQGPATGLYFWLTSGSGLVQGVQGQYRSPAYGYPNWTDVDALCSTCFGFCTDFNFRVCGKVCWLIHDSGDFSKDGFVSRGFPGLPIYLSNSFDNFQIPPGENASLCRLETWIATNCNPNRIYVELYDNDCDSPSGLPVKLDVNTPGWQPPEQVFDDGQPCLVQGLPVYKIVFECPGVELREGRNYWLTVALHWFGSPHERAFWLFGPEGGCGQQMNQSTLGGGAEYRVDITEGRFRSDFLGLPDFTPISEILNDDSQAVGVGGSNEEDQRDFAFRLWIGTGTSTMLENDPRLMITSGPWNNPTAPVVLPAELHALLYPPTPTPPPASPTGGR